MKSAIVPHRKPKTCIVEMRNRYKGSIREGGKEVWLDAAERERIMFENATFSKGRWATWRLAKKRKKARKQEA